MKTKLRCGTVSAATQTPNATHLSSLSALGDNFSLFARFNVREIFTCSNLFSSRTEPRPRHIEIRLSSHKGTFPKDFAVQNLCARSSLCRVQWPSPDATQLSRTAGPCTCVVDEQVEAVVSTFGLHDFNGRWNRVEIIEICNETARSIKVNTHT